MLNTQIRGHYSVSGICVAWATIGDRDYIAVKEGTREQCEKYLEVEREGIERKLKRYWDKQDAVNRQNEELNERFPKKSIVWDECSEEFILYNKSGKEWKRIKLEM